MTRRFHADEYHRVSGIDLRISRGTKGEEACPDPECDLRLEVGVMGRWWPVRMELALFLVEFFTENEDHLQKYHRPWWRQNGQRYFLAKCVEAVRIGWRAVAEEIERQRKRVA